MIATTRRVVIGAAVLGVLGAGGCAAPTNHLATNNGPTQKPSASASILAPPSASPTAREHSGRGAQEFALYWFNAVNYAIETGGVGPLEQASESGCAPCRTLVSAVHDNYADGGYAQGGTYTILSTNIEAFTEDDRQNLSVTFNRSPRSLLAPDGQLRGSVEASSFQHCEMVLDWSGDSWRVLTVIADSPLV